MQFSRLIESQLNSFQFSEKSRRFRDIPELPVLSSPQPSTECIGFLASLFAPAPLVAHGLPPHPGEQHRTDRDPDQGPGATGTPRRPPSSRQTPSDGVWRRAQRQTCESLGKSRQIATTSSGRARGASPPTAGAAARTPSWSRRPLGPARRVLKGFSTLLAAAGGYGIRLQLPNLPDPRPPQPPPR